MSWYVAKSLEVLKAQVDKKAPHRKTFNDGTKGDKVSVRPQKKFFSRFATDGCFSGIGRTTFSMAGLSEIGSSSAASRPTAVSPGSAELHFPWLKKSQNAVLGALEDATGIDADLTPRIREVSAPWQIIYSGSESRSSSRVNKSAASANCGLKAGSQLQN